ncbi:hypothetical protein [Rhizobium sp. P28RR-XV]|uniref:hypothetical protein n=1 Tax=Rhizobium sp. P28RR-XV TaxID=2726737 RepID=UPI001FF05A3B|nr:hypothetical protein [Rhizobium sp. P28RR-XV]
MNESRYAEIFAKCAEPFLRLANHRNCPAVGTFLLSGEALDNITVNSPSGANNDYDVRRRCSARSRDPSPIAQIIRAYIAISLKYVGARAAGEFCPQPPGMRFLEKPIGTHQVNDDIAGEALSQGR